MPNPRGVRPPITHTRTPQDVTKQQPDAGKPGLDKDETEIQHLPGKRLPPAPPAPTTTTPPDETTAEFTIDRGSAPVAVLIPLDAHGSHSVHAIFAGNNLIGRSEKCQIRLESKYVSGEHFSLVHRSNTFVLTQHSRRNSTAVNGEDVEEHVELRDGDVIETVGLRFSFRTALPTDERAR